MRRILLTAVGATALALTAPAAALAGKHHHHHHHKRHSRHAQVSFRHLGPIAAGPSTTPSNGATPTTTPTTSEENAGKVTSYTGGVLTITLADGSTVSGKVTANTRFRCISATATPPPPQGDQDDESGQGDDNGWGDDRDGGDRNQQGGPPWQQGQPGPPAGGQWQGGNDDENGSDDDWDDEEAPVSNEPPCDSSALMENAVVRAAELRIAPGGAEFEWITLVR